MEPKAASDFLSVIAQDVGSERLDGVLVYVHAERDMEAQSPSSSGSKTFSEAPGSTEEISDRVDAVRHLSYATRASLVNNMLWSVPLSRDI
jgi:hypothetical protein